MNVGKLQPFGVEITAITPEQSIDSIPIEDLRALVGVHHLAVMRGFAWPADAEMLAFCRHLGSILEWEFGAVNELQVRSDARNYLYTRSAVPFHWDGAFAGKVPHYIFFHCQVAPPPNGGGETTFCDTPSLLEHIAPSERERWENTRITYSTEKIVHYGGSFTAPLLSPHPVTGRTVLRFAEPVEDLNPVRLTIEGLPPGEQPAFLDRMHALLNDPAVCYAHAWRSGDIVLADNHTLLHGRRTFTQAAPRHLRRVNILGAEPEKPCGNT